MVPEIVIILWWEQGSLWGRCGLVEVTVLVKMVVITVEKGEVPRLEVGKVEMIEMVGTIMTKVVKGMVIMEVMVGMNDGGSGEGAGGGGDAAGEMVVVVEGGQWS